MMAVDVIGYIAGVLIVINLLPQLYKILYNRSIENIAIQTYVILFIAQIFWTIYGFLRDDLQIILTNVTSGCITLSILSAYMCLR